MTNRMITFVCLLLGLTLSDGGMAQTQPSNPSNTVPMFTIRVDRTDSG